MEPWIAVVILAVSVIIIGGIVGKGDAKRKAELEAKQNEALNQVLPDLTALVESGDIFEEQKVVLAEWATNNKHDLFGINKRLESAKGTKQRIESMVSRYGIEQATRMLRQQYWVGMTDEQVIECKGQPDKIEKEELKTKTKHTYIYGNKNSGDYFVIENGVVVKFVDR